MTFSTSHALTALILIASTGAAQVGSTAPNQSLKDFAAAHPLCHEWSDGCAVCTRGVGAAFHCSLPGIACVPKDLICRHGMEGLPSPPAPYLAPNPDDLNKATPK